MTDRRAMIVSILVGLLSAAFAFVVVSTQCGCGRDVDTRPDAMSCACSKGQSCSDAGCVTP